MLAKIAVGTGGAGTDRRQAGPVLNEGHFVGVSRGSFDEKDEFFQRALLPSDANASISQVSGTCIVNARHAESLSGYSFETMAKTSYREAL